MENCDLYEGDLLQLLMPMKVDLGIKSDAYDVRLLDQIRTAIQEITAEGATLEKTARDRNLILMYAEWRWRCRVTQEPMGRMLRLALNNRILGEKAQEEQS
jgi:hypothetical protein